MRDNACQPELTVRINIITPEGHLIVLQSEELVRVLHMLPGQPVSCAFAVGNLVNVTILERRSPFHFHIRLTDLDTGVYRLFICRMAITGRENTSENHFRLLLSISSCVEAAVILPDLVSLQRGRLTRNHAFYESTNRLDHFL